MTRLNEAAPEQIALTYLRDLGWQTAYGPDISPDGDTLRAIARELVETVRRDDTLDWTLRANVRSKLRVAVKRVLRSHGYPPDQQDQASLIVLEQAEALTESLLAAA